MLRFDVLISFLFSLTTPPIASSVPRNRLSLKRKRDDTPAPPRPQPPQPSPPAPPPSRPLPAIQRQDETPMREDEMCQTHVKVPKVNRINLGKRKRTVTG